MLWIKKPGCALVLLLLCLDVSQLFTSKSDLAYSKTKTNIFYKAYLIQGL